MTAEAPQPTTLGRTQSIEGESGETSPLNSFVLKPKSINAKYGSAITLPEMENTIAEETKDAFDTNEMVLEEEVEDYNGMSSTTTPTTQVKNV